MRYALVILDRDGVINHDSADYIKSPSEWHPIPGSLAAIAALNQLNIKVAIATNQSGIARGYFSEDGLAGIHNTLLTALKQYHGHIDYIAYCPHHPDDGCTCRKPEPGLLIQISQALHIPLDHAIMIGDSFKDYQAAQRAGCDFALVKTGNGEHTVQQLDTSTVPIFSDLAAAVLEMAEK